MPDAHDTARQWLAEVLYDTKRVFADDVETIADAILSAPGVEVETQSCAVATSGYSFPAPAASEHATHTRVVIRLPAQPITGGRAVTQTPGQRAAPDAFTDGHGNVSVGYHQGMRRVMLTDTARGDLGSAYQALRRVFPWLDACGGGPLASPARPAAPHALGLPGKEEEMVNETVAWYRAQIDEDERVARAAGSDRWVAVDLAFIDDSNGRQVIGDENIAAGVRAHIVRHDPDRELREVEAKRRVLDRHRPVEIWTGHDHIPAGQPGSRQLLWLECAWCIKDTSDGEGAAYDCRHSNRRWPCPDVLDVMSVFAGRPGYREGWRP